MASVSSPTELVTPQDYAAHTALKIAIEEGYEDPLLLLAQIQAESGFNCKAQNPGSSAGGCSQFIDRTWRGECTGNRFNVADSTRCHIKLLERDGFWHWEESRVMIRKDGTDAGWLKLYIDVQLELSRKRWAEWELAQLKNRPLASR